MYLSLNWVKNWLKIPNNLSHKEIALALTMSTVEVEEVLDQAKDLEGIVVGKIKQITKHPQADLLQVCQVSLGETQEQIVCGGSNLRTGMLVAVATIGSKVRWHGQGDWVRLAATKIRGVESRGMIVAASEVGLDLLFPTNNEKEIIDLSDFKIKAGQKLSQALSLDDVIINIDNKSINHRPDLWGQYGLARELAAIYRVKLAEYKIEPLAYQDKLGLKAEVQDPSSCYRYSALALSNVKVAESPWWLKVKLLAVGLRPINNIVDATNFVMYELGQPLHAFDAKQIEDHKIVVKLAKANDNFVTLDGVKRKLSGETLMIADGKKYLAIAGIMGGQNSEIVKDTTDIILESACFKASTIRRASQFLGLRSESSARFEKSLDPNLTLLALHKVARLILAMNPEAEVSSNLIDINNNPFKEISLTVPESLLLDRMGTVIPAKEIKDILTRLQFKVDYKKKVFNIQVPSFRATKDISVPEDIVEEVSRIYGYDKLPYVLPQLTLQEPIFDIAHDAAKEIKTWLAWGQAYTEVSTYPFTNQFWANTLGFDLTKNIKVKNAVSPDQAYLNTSLLPNLFNAAEENYRWHNNFKIFELERVFDKKENSNYHTDQSHKGFLPQQPKHLTGIELCECDAETMYLSVKGLLESLLKHWGLNCNWENLNLPYASIAGRITFQDIELGQFGLLKKELFTSAKQKVNLGFWDLNFSTLIKYINSSKTYTFLPKYPSIDRDIAIVIDKQITWQSIAQEINKVSSLIRNLEPFDVYTGKEVPENQKSLAFHLEFRSDDRTLLTEDVDQLMATILANLEKKFKAKLR